MAESTNPLTIKLNKLLDKKIENDTGLLDLLNDLSGYFPENTLRARRTLRTDIERQCVTVNEDYIEQFEVPFLF